MSTIPTGLTSMVKIQTIDGVAIKKLLRQSHYHHFNDQASILFRFSVTNEIFYYPKIKMLKSSVTFFQLNKYQNQVAVLTNFKLSSVLRFIDLASGA